MNCEQHIEQLAREHEITVWRLDDVGDERANVNGRAVWIPRDLSDEDDYLCALHEIGHVVTNADGGELQREWAAWAWAFQHARCTLTAELLERTWREAFGTYFEEPIARALITSTIARWREEDESY